MTLDSFLCMHTQNMTIRSIPVINVIFMSTINTKLLIIFMYYVRNWQILKKSFKLACKVNHIILSTVTVHIVPRHVWCMQFFIVK